MRRIAAFVLLTALLALTLAVALPATAGGNYGTTTTTTPNDPCDEYHETRHPECQTTTTYATTTTGEQTTTTQPEVTTTTTEQTTTTFTEQTTTTAAPCAPGQIHQPPLCVDPTTTTVPVFDTTTTAPVEVDALEELPFTGLDTRVLFGLAIVLAGLGYLALRLAREG